MCTERRWYLVAWDMDREDCRTFRAAPAARRGPGRVRLLRTGAVDLDLLVIHIMLLGCEFEVVEPAELTDRIRAARDLLGRALGPGEVKEM